MPSTSRTMWVSLRACVSRWRSVYICWWSRPTARLVCWLCWLTSIREMDLWLIYAMSWNISEMPYITNCCQRPTRSVNGLLTYMRYRQSSNISRIKFQNLNFHISSCGCLCPILWSQVLSWTWSCSWSSANRWCSNYIWMTNSFIAY